LLLPNTRLSTLPGWAAWLTQYSAPRLSSSFSNSTRRHCTNLILIKIFKLFKAAGTCTESSMLGFTWRSSLLPQKFKFLLLKRQRRYDTNWMRFELIFKVLEFRQQHLLHQKEWHNKKGKKTYILPGIRYIKEIYIIMI